MKKSLRRIYSILLVMCMVISTMTIPASATMVTGPTAEDANLIYYRDFEGETGSNLRFCGTLQQNLLGNWTYNYSSKYLKCMEVDGSTVMMEAFDNNNSNVYRFAENVTSGRFYLSMDIGFHEQSGSGTDGYITFYADDYTNDYISSGGWNAVINNAGRRYALYLEKRAAGGGKAAHMIAKAGLPYDGLTSIDWNAEETEITADKLHRFDFVYDLDADYVWIYMDGNLLEEQEVEGEYKDNINQITGIGMRMMPGMFVDNIKIATAPADSFDAAIEKTSATSFDVKFTHSVNNFTADNILINSAAPVSVTKKNANLYSVVCSSDPDTSAIQLQNVKNILNEVPKTTAFNGAPPITPNTPSTDPAASIVLETTNAAPTDVVPMGETLKAKVVGVTPTAYQWWCKYVNRDNATPEGTGAEFVLPANYVEYFESRGAVEVWCDVTYEGGVLTTSKVTMDSSYERVIPWATNNSDNVAAEGPVGTVYESNPNYTFEVDGKKFVLADEENVKGAAYFIVAADAYGDIYLEGKRPEGTESEARGWKEFSLTSGGFVNDNGTTMETKLLGEGNDYTQFNDTSNTKYALPDAFDAYIDMDHSWPYVVDQWGTVRQMKTGVTLLSFSDFHNYGDRIGYKDNLFNIDGVDYKVLLRDFSGANETVARAGVYVTTAGNVTDAGRDTNKYQVRPCFWLAKNFFEKQVIDLSKAGVNVIKLLKNSDYVNQTIMRNTYNAAGKLEEYDRYINATVNGGISLSTRSGDAVSNVKLLDTLIATLTGVDGEIEYIWQTNGTNGWETIKNGSELALAQSLAGKRVRAAASNNGIFYYTDTITVPSVATAAEAPGTRSNNKILNNPENSNPDRLFTVDGKSFVLLEEFENDEQAYYVTTTDSYGSANAFIDGGIAAAKRFSSYGTFGGDTSNNLVSHILYSGNDYSGISDSEPKVTLPEGIVNNIYNDTVWNRYRFPRWVSAGVAGTVVYPVNMLSQTDLVKYESILGYKDNVFDKGGSYYLLRDTCEHENVNVWYDNSVVSADGKSLQLNEQLNSEDTGRPKGTPLVRPAFYLSGDFFKNVKIDIETAGRDIIDIMKAKYYVEDLAALGYAEIDLENAGLSHKINMGTISAPIISGAAAVTVNVPLSNANDTEQTVTLILGIYDSNGKSVGLDIKKVTIPQAVGDAAGTTTATCTATVAGSSGTSAMVMLWTNLNDMISLSNSQAFN